MLKVSHTFLKCFATTRNYRYTFLQLNKLSQSAAIIKTKDVPSKKSETTKSNGNSMVAAAFAALQLNEPDNNIRTPFTDDRIVKATTINELLSISEGNGISRRHALKVVSVLADWSSTGKIELSDFENDDRFLKLCRVLTRGGQAKKNFVSRNDDLSTILSVTADDEAAKLVASITLPQMVKVMTTLALKKRRSTLLLRALSFNITKSTDNLNIKQSADLLYSMAVLNYVDENLFNKIQHDVCSKLNDNFKFSAVVGSIVTSLGLLKYKNPDFLDTLCNWFLNNHSMCRSQDIFSLFLTLGVLYYFPPNADKLFKELIPQLNILEARKPIIWVEFIWSLVLLNQANSNHISSVLNDDFLKNFNNNYNKNSNLSTKLKLLNINGMAEHLLTGYNGPKITMNSDYNEVSPIRSKEKSEMVDIVIDTMKNLIQSDINLKTNINTKMGFFIDAKCILDHKCNSLPITLSNEERPDVHKVAILVQDYHDLCRGKVEPTGINILAKKLLQAQGYKILSIPYNEFKLNDKLVQRVLYLENKLKDLILIKK